MLTILSAQMSYIVTKQFLNRLLQWGVTIFISNRKAFKQRLCRYTAIKLRIHLQKLCTENRSNLNYETSRSFCSGKLQHLYHL